MKYIVYTSGKPPSLLRKAAAIVATVLLAGLALMFSAVLLVFLLIAGAAAYGYFWWKTRELRKEMRDFQQNSEFTETASFDSRVIEGEAIRVDESRNDSEGR